MPSPKSKSSAVSKVMDTEFISPVIVLKLVLVTAKVPPAPSIDPAAKVMSKLGAKTSVSSTKWISPASDHS